MSVLIELAVPLILASVGIHALIFGTDIFPALCRGAMQGLETLKDMLPTLIVLFPAVYMLRASGALDALSALLAPLMERIGVPAETVPLALLRPVSGCCCRYHQKQRRGFSRRADRGCDDRIKRNNVLRYCGVFWRGEDKKHAPCDTGGAAGRPCGVSRLGMDMRTHVGIIRERPGNNSIT